jgi:hypothetical protein
MAGNRIRSGTVVAVTTQRPGATEVRVDVDGDGPADAIAYHAVTGGIEVGARVLLNTTGVALGLGTGGLHVVMGTVGSGGETDLDGPGHIVKARYTPGQVSVLAVEEEASPHRDVMLAATDLGGLVVVAAELHSMVPVVAAAVRAEDERLRVAYVMSDGAALPYGLSRLAARMREVGLLAGTVTAGQAFGGDLEAVTVHSALLAAKEVLGAHVVVVAQGPGGAGTGTPLGFSGVQVAEAINAAGALGGTPVACVRMSGADARGRHRGVSHHTLTALGRLALAPATVVLPAGLDADLTALAAGQLDDAGVTARHRVVHTEPADAAEALGRWGLEVTTMGRGVAADPLFFAAATAAGRHAAELARERGGVPGGA